MCQPLSMLGSEKFDGIVVGGIGAGAVNNNKLNEVSPKTACNHSDIAARMLCFGKQNPMDAVKQNLFNAIQLRQTIINSETDCYRIINGEGDFLPGLVVDKYNDLFVLQSSTCGMDKLKKLVAEKLIESFGNSISVYEKSDNASRKKEKLAPIERFLHGNNHKTTCKENNIKFFVDVKTSQKTGLFLDMREMRAFIGALCVNKKVLNCFCYTGGFSLYAANNKAAKIISKHIMSSDHVLNFSQDEFDYLKSITLMI